MEATMPRSYGRARVGQWRSARAEGSVRFSGIGRSSYG